MRILTCIPSVVCPTQLQDLGCETAIIVGSGMEIRTEEIHRGFRVSIVELIEVPAMSQALGLLN